MFASLALTAAVFSATFLVDVAHAEFLPTGPAPGDSFNAGSKCKIAWTGDSSSPTTWKETNIQLMSGSNFEMVHLTTVTKVDGTKSGTYEWDCPEVKPNSAIYFYQFSSALATDATTWTGRFTIASSTGDSTPPSEDTQPGSNDPIPWGTGALVDPASAVAPPPYLSGSTSSSSASASGSQSATTSSSASVSASVPPSSMSTVRTVPTAKSSSPIHVASASASASAGANGDGNGALSLKIDVSVMKAAVALGASAFAFTALF